MRRFRVTDLHTEAAQDHTLLGVVNSVEVGEADVDEIADLEVGERIRLNNRIQIERRQ